MPCSSRCLINICWFIFTFNTNLNLHLSYTISPAYHTYSKDCINRKVLTIQAIIVETFRKWVTSLENRPHCSLLLGVCNVLQTLGQVPQGRKFVSPILSQDYAKPECFRQMQQWAATWTGPWLSEALCLWKRGMIHRPPTRTRSPALQGSACSALG